MSELLGFLRDVFRGLYNLFLGTQDTKIIYAVVAPLLVCAGLAVFCDFILPSILSISFAKKSWNTFAYGFDFNKSVIDKNIERGFHRFGEFGDLDYDSVNGITKYGFGRFIKHPLRFTRWLTNRKRLEESIIREKMLEEYRADFENLYGIAPNNKQLQMFIMQEGKREWRRKRSNTRARLNDTQIAEIVDAIKAEVVSNGGNISTDEQIPEKTSATIKKDLDTDNPFLMANNRQLKE